MNAQEKNNLTILSTAAARAYFPRGLLQPEGSFRFSLDALLLACFLPAVPGARLLDLGTGCGVVALGMLCRQPLLDACGLDRHPELLEAARQNAVRLGFNARFTVLRHDLLAVEAFPEAQRGSFSLVLANPPYRQAQRGRLPVSGLRRSALIEQEGGLAAFCRAAGQALCPGGRFGIIFPAVRQADLLEGLAEAGLAPVRLMLVRARADDTPMLLLAEAERASSEQEGDKAGCRARSAVEGQGQRLGGLPGLAQMLTLYENRGRASVFTGQALAFCPFLACNPKG